MELWKYQNALLSTLHCRFSLEMLTWFLRKKSKCSGEQPCDRCSNGGKHCAYTAEYTRGREPTIPIRHSPQVDQIQEQTQENTKSGDNNLEIVSVLLSDLPGYPQVKSSHHAEFENQDFISSSGGTIFNRSQNNLNSNVSTHQKASIFMFGDPPLPEFDGTFLFLPPVEIARTMISTYFNIVTATVRCLHRPTVETWMGSYNTNFMSNQTWQKSIRAILLLILASAHGYKEFRPGDEDIRSVMTARLLLKYTDIFNVLVFAIFKPQITSYSMKQGKFG